MSKYTAVAGQNVGTWEQLRGAALSVKPYTLATGDDVAAVEALGIRTAGHEDVRVWDVAGKCWVGGDES
jgi:hypothetical protein